MWILAIILPAVLVVVLAEVWHTKRRKQGHAASHARMTDAEYLTKLGVPKTKQDLCLAFRRAMADAAGVPPETVYPSDSMAHLCELGFDGVDTIEILLFLERRLGVRISDRKAKEALAGKLTPQMAFADFVRCYVEEWDSIVE